MSALIPVALAEKDGKSYTNAACRDIPLTLDDEGFWSGDYYEDEATKVPGFFPLDDFKYLAAFGLLHGLAEYSDIPRFLAWQPSCIFDLAK